MQGKPLETSIRKPGNIWTSLTFMCFPLVSPHPIPGSAIESEGVCWVCVFGWVWYLSLPSTPNHSTLPLGGDLCHLLVRGWSRVAWWLGGPSRCLSWIVHQPTQLTVSQLGKGGTSSPGLSSTPRWWYNCLPWPKALDQETFVQSGDIRSWLEITDREPLFNTNQQFADKNLWPSFGKHLKTIIYGQFWCKMRQWKL